MLPCRKEAGGLRQSFYRHHQLRHLQSRRGLPERHDERRAVQRDGLRPKQIRQGQPLVEHALRIPQRVLHGLFPREPQRRGLPRPRFAARDAHCGRYALRGFPPIRFRLHCRAGAPGLLHQYPHALRRENGGHRHAALRRPPLHLPRRTFAHLAQPRRGTYQRNGCHAAPHRSERGGRHQTPRHVLLRCTPSGLSYLLRDARGAQRARCGLLEIPASQERRRGRMGPRRQ